MLTASCPDYSLIKKKIALILQLPTVPDVQGAMAKVMAATGTRSSVGPLERITNCPSEGRYGAMVRRYTRPHTPMTVVEVGINKGYLIAEVLHALGFRGPKTKKGSALFNALNDTNTKALRKEASKLSKFAVDGIFSQLCGACRDCTHESQDFEGDDVPIGNVTFIGFDGQKDLVEHAQQYFTGDEFKGVTFDLRHGVVSDKAGTAFFCGVSQPGFVYADELARIVESAARCNYTWYDKMPGVAVQGVYDGFCRMRPTLHLLPRS